MIYDFGRVSCGTWIEPRAARNVSSDVRKARERISVFLSAYNLYVHPGVDVISGTDREGTYGWLDKWLDKFCRDDPTKTMASAMIGLIEHLRAR
jgi:hypothetical protein